MAMMPNPMTPGGMAMPGMPDPTFAGAPAAAPKARKKTHGKKRRHGGRKKRSR